MCTLELLSITFSCKCKLQQEPKPRMGPLKVSVPDPIGSLARIKEPFSFSFSLEKSCGNKWQLPGVDWEGWNGWGFFECYSNTRKSCLEAWKRPGLFCRETFGQGVLCSENLLWFCFPSKTLSSLFFVCGLASTNLICLPAWSEFLGMRVQTGCWLLKIAQSSLQRVRLLEISHRLVWLLLKETGPSGRGVEKRKERNEEELCWCRAFNGSLFWLSVSFFLLQPLQMTPPKGLPGWLPARK